MSVSNMGPSWSLENGQEYEITTFRTEDVYELSPSKSSDTLLCARWKTSSVVILRSMPFALNEKKGEIVDLFHGLERFGKQGPSGPRLCFSLAQMHSGSCEDFVFKEASLGFG